MSRVANDDDLDNIDDYDSNDRQTKNKKGLDARRRVEDYFEQKWLKDQLGDLFSD